jgi:uncharacterized membrane protein YraQ (UPF0718 family)
MGVLGWSFMLAGGLLLLVSVFTGHPLAVVLLGAACISGIGMTFLLYGTFCDGNSGC